MPEITFIRAGSTIFAKNYMGTSLVFLSHFSTLVLHDMDADRLPTTETITGKLAATSFRRHP